MAAMIGIGMASWWLDLPWQPTWRLFVFGAIGGAVLVGCAGSMSAWRLTLSAPARILRGS
jgi:predicted lysophospholipase L1 biosynthesis ABC-type transport system permease subunit